jgi:hypothetical protein
MNSHSIKNQYLERCFDRKPIGYWLSRTGLWGTQRTHEYPQADGDKLLVSTDVTIPVGG